MLTVVSVVCSSALICTLVSTFITDGSTKKIVNLVLGAFIVCCMIIPVRNALGSVGDGISQHTPPSQLSSTDDEAYSKAVLSQTKLNLESTLADLLLQNNIKINRSEIILSQTSQNSIIISSISIYISNDYKPYIDTIINITYDNFGTKPTVMTE